MDEKDQASSIKLGLDLGLRLTTYEPKRDNSKKNKRVLFLDLPIPFHQNGHDTEYLSPKLMQVDEIRGSENRIFNGRKADDCERNYSKNCSRKKLRLDKDQITLLEESFEQHSSLTMAQKQILAERLNLKPRQVEVWFQNRRARTKLKQTEIDREYLKKNCERLSDENRQLKRQLLELRSTVKTENPPPPPAAAASPLRQFFHSMPKTVAAAALKTCPSSEKIWNNRGVAKQETAAAAVMEVSHGDELNSRAGLES